MGFSGVSKSASVLKRQFAELLRVYAGSVESGEDKSMLHRISDGISENADSLSQYYGQVSDGAENVVDKISSLDLREDGVRSLANVSTGAVQAFANAGTRNAANKMALALASGGLPALKTILTSDRMSLIRGMWARIPYNFVAIPSSLKVAELASGGKSPVDMTNLEKVRSVALGSSAEFMVGSSIDMVSLLNELSAIKIAHNFKANPEKLSVLSDSTLKNIIRSFKTEKGAYDFFRKNEEILVKKIPEFDKISKKDLFERMNSREMKIFMIENDLRSPTFTKPSAIKDVKSVIPEFAPKIKDVARSIAASAPFHIFRNSSFLLPFYFATRKDGGLNFEKFATAFTSGAITSIPHNIGNVAIAESMRGQSVSGAVKSGIKQTFESAVKRPQVIAMAAVIRGIANICGAVFYSKTTSDSISDSINDSLLELLEVDCELTPEEREEVDKIAFERSEEFESVADKFMRHHEYSTLFENGGGSLDSDESEVSDEFLEKVNESLTDLAAKYIDQKEENWIFDEEVSVKKFPSKDIKERGESFLGDDFDASDIDPTKFRPSAEAENPAAKSLEEKSEKTR